MEELISRMEQYAHENKIPIMMEEGLDFMLDFIKKHEVKDILEIGAAIGYSAIRMCMVNEDIHVTTIERDNVRYEEAVKNIKEAGFESRITLIHGDALEYEFSGSYDLLFIDAAKAQYIKFFERFTPLLKTNGYVVSDNLKFHGFVEHPEMVKKSKDLRQLVRKLTDYVNYLKDNKEWQTEFNDFGDGVAITSRRVLDFDGYIFDMDGLLVDSERVAWESWQVVAKRHNFELPFSVYSKFLGHSLKDIKEIFEREVKTDLDFYAIKEESHDVSNEYYKNNGIRVMPGVINLLEYLKSKGKRMVVATSTYQERAKWRIELAGLEKYFDTIISGDMIEHSKPNPEIFEVAQRTMKVSKDQCVVFEDSNTGIEAAYRAGIRSIMIPGLVEADENSKQHAFKIYASLDDVVTYLKEND